MPKRAVLHVDIQNDFCPGGALAVKDGDQVVELANKITEDAIKKEAFHVFSGDCHPDISEHFKDYGGTWPKHCIRETRGIAFHPQLKIPYGSFVVLKGTGQANNGYSAFDQFDVEIYVSLQKDLIRLSYQDLETLLLSLGVETIDIDGLATDYCVRATALDATQMGFTVRLMTDACRAVNLNPDDGEKAIEEMRQAGVIVTTTTEVLAEK